jgi:apolipoprotein D and lipocalin family protein
METGAGNKGCKSVDIKTVDKLELNRYLGVWYEIARYDHRFERGLTDVRAEYVMQVDGMIKVINTGLDKQSGKRKEVIGKAKTTEAPGILRVSFFWIFYSDYRILSLDDDYQWALISAGRSDKYLWILSRTEKLPEETLKTILAEAERRGFDVSRLMYV